jgi:acetyl-CoA/propionyl-CoA carboxylase biotin carboxyl carrier protein
MKERAAALEPDTQRLVPALKQAAVVLVDRVVEVDGKRFTVRMHDPEQPWRELARRRAERVRAGGAGGGDAVVSPMQGTVLSVAVAEGDSIEAGTVICIVEAMKMENEVRAHRAGAVVGLTVSAGAAVGSGQVICRIE